ncbi:ANTAR domain-containing protein [Streptomyces sp. 1222.5]|uniref:GAF and ANTAR domain-containing protein n=1 Tax=unclassified Streptomyces TaxID=2593676 RepID=UPI00089BA0AF|nr:MULTISPECIES: GAF and ANTAR domain-containing protein [unclassified Streptomyces]PKW09133.1 ANTAR domain-containing protein [Streptomyces sp. 5112.2]SEC43699.1 ANTAR domain-containing protein [Streptomyces sp. 1222.5]
MPPEEPFSAGRGLPPETEAWLRVSETLGAAARGADDPGREPGALCQACVRLLPITGSSVSISGGKGVRITWCASDRVAARLAELQYTVGDGPCQTALEQGAPVVAADLTQGPDVRRWPIFAHEAVGLGVRAVFSLPLGVSGAAVGTLDLYSDRAGGLVEQDLRTALWMRDAVTYALMNLQAATHADAEGEAEDEAASWVAASEADHTEVYQAVGMVMVQLDVDPEQALDRLRARAFADGRTVSQLAREVLARKLRFRPEPVGPGPSGDGAGAHAREAGYGGSYADEPYAGEERRAAGEGGPYAGDEGRETGGGGPHGGGSGRDGEDEGRDGER